MTKEEQMAAYIGALTILVGALLAVLDEKMPDLREKLRGAIDRQHGVNGDYTDEQIDLALNIINGLRHFTRN